MNIHFGLDPSTPNAVQSIAAGLQRALIAAGHRVTSTPEAPGAGAVAVHWTAARPASGLWLAWDHKGLCTDVSSPAESVLEPEPHADLVLGPWLGAAQRSATSLPLPSITSGSSGARPSGGPSRVALAGAARHSDVLRAREACERAEQAGLSVEVVPAESTPPGSWDALVFGPGAFADHLIALPLQAMAMGVPCVLPDLPLVRQPAGDAALYCNFDSVDELAEAIVLATRHDELRANLAHNGQRFARAHGDDAAVACVIEAVGHNPTIPSQTATTQPDELTEKLVQALRDAASLFGQRDDWPRATDHLEAARCIDGDDQELVTELAHAYFMTGDEARALFLYEQLLETNRDDPALHENRGLVLMATTAYGAAAEAFASALAQRQDDPDLLNNMGVALFHKGDREGAQRAFQQALARNPLHPDARANLAALA